MQLATTNADENQYVTIGNKIPVWQQLNTNHSDPWKVVTRPAFAHHSLILVSSTLVVLSGIHAQQAHDVDVKMTSDRRRCDVMMSHRR